MTPHRLRFSGLGVAISILLAIATHLLAQEPPRPVGTRLTGIGTYRGTRSGTTTDVRYNGDTVTESTECSLTMRFDADGSMTYDAGRYIYTKIYSKKTTNGFLKEVTQIKSDGGQSTIRSHLTMVLTQYDMVWFAAWQPRVEVPGEVVQEIWWTDARGRVQQRRTVSSTTKLVYCDIHVLWRGRDQRGPGLPLRGSQTRPDEIGHLPWVTVNAEWALQRSQ